MSRVFVRRIRLNKDLVRTTGHDLAEAVRLAHRIVVSGRQDGIVAERTLYGVPGQRDDRAVFETVQTWMQDPSFADLFDGDRQ